MNCLIIANIVGILIAWVYGAASAVYTNKHNQNVNIWNIVLCIIIPCIPFFGCMLVIVLLTIDHIECDYFFEDAKQNLIEMFKNNNALASLGVKRVPILLWPIAAILPILQLFYIGLKYFAKGFYYAFLVIAEYVFGFYRCDQCNHFFWINVGKIQNEKGYCCEYCDTANTLAP